MENFDPKQLAKLAKECRKAGIKSFKGFGMEFTLTDEAPKSVYKQSKMAQDQSKSFYTDAEAKIETDAISDEALLFWSSQGIPVEETQ